MRCAVCVVLLVLVLVAGAFAGADEDAKTHYVAGEKALADFDLETAIKELSAAVKLKPSSLAARDKLTEAYAAYVKFLKGEVETWKKRHDELAAKKDSQVIKIVARGSDLPSPRQSASAPPAGAGTPAGIQGALPPDIVLDSIKISSGSVVDELVGLGRNIGRRTIGYLSLTFREYDRNNVQLDTSTAVVQKIAPGKFEFRASVSHRTMRVELAEARSGD